MSTKTRNKMVVSITTNIIGNGIFIPPTPTNVAAVKGKDTEIIENMRKTHTKTKINTPATYTHSFIIIVYLCFHI